MAKTHARSLRVVLCGALLGASSAAAAHPVTVDGDATEWFTRSSTADNTGLIARDATGRGEYIWRDALADTRTDIATPEVVADIAAFQVTGDAMGVGFLLRRQPGVAFNGAPIQVQIAIDTDLVDASGQEFFAEFGDTKVASGARWERLVETLFGSGGAAKVIDTNFNQVAMVEAVAGAGGDVEIFVPWTALGLMAPPAKPLRFSVATFRAQNNDLTVDVGGANFSNALDAISDYGNPAAGNYPNTYADVQDQIVDYSFDVHFSATGEVYAPLVVQRFLSSASGGGPDEWYAVTNATPGPLSLAGFKLGDEETPDGNEGMLAFPMTAMLMPGASYTIATSGSAYQLFYGAAPDAEIPPGASMAVPDMTPFAAWTGGAQGTLNLANPGDEVLVLDRSNTIVDVAVFGNGAFPGVATLAASPGTDEVVERKAGPADTDDCQADFSNAGKTCTSNAQCGGVCRQCSAGACGDKAMGTGCPDANQCNGDEICDGNGACVAGTTPPCDDNNPCTADSCSMALGCMHANLMAGASCSDADVCNGAEVCDANGMCMAGASLDCDDMDPCTIDACDPVGGCSSTDAPAGSSCSDGDACNGAETCDMMGACVAGTPLDCDDQNPCTADACDMMGGCAHTDVADGTACGDGDACNGDETCAAGVCGAGTAPSCDDQNACTADTCDPMSGCAHTNEAQGAACEDGDPCTTPDTCDGDGVCVPGTCASGGAGGAGGMGGGGMGGAGGAGGNGGGVGGMGGGGQGGAGGGIADGGCGCRAAGEGAGSSLGWLAALVLSFGVARRRRRSA